MRRFRRSVEVARADIVHAIGGLATLVLMFGLTPARDGLAAPRAGGQHACASAIFLADIVLAPMLFVGRALLFVDLAARVGTTRAGAARGRARRRPPPAR